ncbi:Uncharacterized protein BC141101_01399 [Bacillus toyonensis]|uniref:hypothetical protein n=1 Tax=Bacillus TaxID=1386 RepID=UPI000279DBB0|nr:MULTISPECIES: hypothetical protein [Bacillus cereus group]EJR61552.1 hypothetical protein IIO_03005 [Bacillus cereus VD115]KAB0448943.1 hypothetical protein CH334_11185 [Lysinibacillus sp. VIA-II-2016]EJV46187.1 hypothetical protein IEA_03422 [Bacillus toyonensis]EJV93694.1 hypothetical protein IGI_03412 [Bacillus toyonensis]EOP43383.1 hypothetical protein IKI_01273 [Bacillus toyonensis]
MPFKPLSDEELDVKAAMNEATRERFNKYKAITGCSNTAFAVKVGFSRCIIQNWLAGKFDFSAGSLEHIQFVIGSTQEQLRNI